MPGVPPFARDFPEDAALAGAVAAFQRGDYATARKGARALARGSSDDAVRRAARELIARTEPDALARWLVALTGILLTLLTSYWSTRPAGGGPRPMGGPAVPSPPAPSALEQRR